MVAVRQSAYYHLRQHTKVCAHVSTWTVTVCRFNVCSRRENFNVCLWGVNVIIIFNIFQFHNNRKQKEMKEHSYGQLENDYWKLICLVRTYAFSDHYVYALCHHQTHKNGNGQEPWNGMEWTNTCHSWMKNGLKLVIIIWCMAECITRT